MGGGFEAWWVRRESSSERWFERDFCDERIRRVTGVEVEGMVRANMKRRRGLALFTCCGCGEGAGVNLSWGRDGTSSFI